MSTSKTSESDVPCEKFTKYPNNNLRTFKKQYVRRALAKYGSTGTILKTLKAREFRRPLKPVKTGKYGDSSKMKDYEEEVQDIKEEKKRHNELLIKLLNW